MDPSQRLAQNLISESKAYGYTLVIWGAGGLLIHRFGSPNIIQVGLYIGGALTAMIGLTMAAFGQVFIEQQPTDDQLIVASMVHLAATGGNLLVSYVLVVGAKRFGLSPDGAFFLVGFQTTLLYNVFLLIEHSAARVLE
ncbi:hypothetical protein [Halocatena salina]|uniref:Uncharacterized protein n=1 Tax=Halocatena salina TaxID=2934340 RepID=A0A8U0A7U1_9EURY|nr:hypothetical protein [Halocatena salina]UPM45172.1 hypothetical protein MW046_17595 [Halocatena salina]